MKTPVKREKGRVDLFGERFRARAHQLAAPAGGRQLYQRKP
jgi:hypothetical protein